jgi:hypothetical protein
MEGLQGHASNRVGWAACVSMLKRGSFVARSGILACVGKEVVLWEHGQRSIGWGPLWAGMPARAGSLT